jgi:NADH:ubiquinone oxidoreductase subunit 2 (subunit N)
MNLKLGHSGKRVLTIGLVSLIILATGSFILGHVGGYEAKQLLKSSLDGIQTLCNTIVLASATILALLLTLLGISASSDSRLKKDHYQNVLQIARVDSIVFTLAVLTMVIFNLPITSSEKIPEESYDVIYYIAIGLMSLLSSSIIVVVYMLFDTVRNIIKIVGLGVEDHPLVEKETDEE